MHTGAESIQRKPGGRVIGYAAGSKTAKSLLPFLWGTELRPDLLWDAAAGSGSEIMGMMIEQPDFDCLTVYDVVLVLLRNRQTAVEVIAILESTKAAGNIYYYDVLDAATLCLFY
jgi:hypothetical protein